MAITYGTVVNVQTVRSNHNDPVQVAEVFFTMTGGDVYAQANDSAILLVNEAIQNSRRNGKTVTIHGGISAQQARLAATPGIMMGVNTVTVLAVTGLLFQLTLSAVDGTPDLATEHGNGAIGAQSTPFSIMVVFTEA